MIRSSYIIALAVAATAMLVIEPAFAQLTDQEQVGQGIMDWFTAQNMGWVATVLIGVKLVAELAAKMIPDSATGFLGILRKVLKVAAVYIPNRK